MSKRWSPGRLRCGWLGLGSAVRAQGRLPAGPATRRAPPAEATPSPDPTEIAQLPPEGEAAPADPSVPGSHGAYPWGTPSNLMPPGPVAPQRPFEPPFPCDGIAITACESEVCPGH